jgi:subtilisin family serine protease
LQNDPNIKSISLDEERHIIYPVKKSALQEEEDESKTKPPLKKSGLRRQLAESVPYGVERIQADQVNPGPDANDITVCIVDTGYDYGHEDLPGAGIVSGVDNGVYGSGGKWDEDGHGHGTHCGGKCRFIDELLWNAVDISYLTICCSSLCRYCG